MLKNLIERSVQIKEQEEREEEAKKKGEEKVPFQYGGDLEISVYKNGELVEMHKNDELIESFENK